MSTVRFVMLFRGEARTFNLLILHKPTGASVQHPAYLRRVHALSVRNAKLIPEDEPCDGSIRIAESTDAGTIDKATTRLLEGRCTARSTFGQTMRSCRPVPQYTAVLGILAKSPHHRYSHVAWAMRRSAGWAGLPLFNTGNSMDGQTTPLSHYCHERPCAWNHQRAATHQASPDGLLHAVAFGSLPKMSYLLNLMGCHPHFPLASASEQHKTCLLLASILSYLPSSGG